MDGWFQVILAVIGIVTVFITGGGFVKFLDWLNSKEKLAQESEAQKWKREQDARTQERLNAAEEFRLITADLRGEIHGLRERLHALGLQYEVVLKENAALRAQVHSLEERVGDLSVAGGLALVTVDSEGKVIAWSPSAVEMFGWTETDAIGKDLAELIIPAESRALHHGALKRCVLEDRPPRAQSLLFKAKDRWDHVFFVDVALTGLKSQGKWFFSGTIRRRAEKFNS